MDLSPSLFAFFTDIGTGKFPMQWDFTDGSAPPPTTPPQDSSPYVEPPSPSTPTVSSSVVYENVAEVTTSSEVAPVVEPTPVEEPYVEPTPAPWTESTETSYTETTTESATTTETSAAAATTTPSFGDQLALAMKDNDVSGLGAVLVELGNLLKNSTDSTTTDSTTTSY